MNNMIIKRLEEARGSAVSGEELAKLLNVSRVTISKRILKLKEEGYDIESVSNKGYTLSNTNDIINEESIKNYLKDTIFNNIIIFKEIDSTNDYLKSITNKNVEEGTVVISDNQLGGKGRKGRSFVCKPNKGIYMSMLLRPNIELNDASILSALSAVAIVRVLRNIYEINATIKWVNDIFIDGLKVSGILSEASIELDTLTYEYIIIGIGINVHNLIEDFPIGLRNKVTSLDLNTSEFIIRNKLIGEILNEFNSIYSSMKSKEIIEEYKSYSCLINKNVYIVDQKELGMLKVIDIDDKANLVVKDKLGNILNLNSKEVSVLPDEN
ncbi:MAG: biotin--[acetyl-CoA-carboxylase] ligase [Erysipelotrichaceae bacterium]